MALLCRSPEENRLTWMRLCSAFVISQNITTSKVTLLHRSSTYKKSHISNVGFVKSFMTKRFFFLKLLSWTSKARRWLMFERTWVRILTQSKIALFLHHSFGSKQEYKLLETLTWHCCMCCNPATGRVDIEQLLAYKIQLRGLERNESLSANWDQCPTKNTSTSLLGQ